jgi:hypothetical protein
MYTDGELLAPSDTTHFAHNSERQFARLLDFYQIEWDYEPRSFVIGWDEEGEPNQRFTPDFYLPAYDTYIEITTLNQRLVTKKNRKVRLLRELYPGIKCKIFYQRDYVDLLIKYGLEPPSQGSKYLTENDSDEPEDDAVGRTAPPEQGELLDSGQDRLEGTDGLWDDQQTG